MRLLRLGHTILDGQILEDINEDMIFAVENFKAILKVELQITSLNTVGKQDAKSGHFGTTFPFFIRLSLKFAGW